MRKTGMGTVSVTAAAPSCPVVACVPFVSFCRHPASTAIAQMATIVSRFIIFIIFPKKKFWSFAPMHF